MASSPQSEPFTLRALAGDCLDHHDDGVDHDNDYHSKVIAQTIMTMVLIMIMVIILRCLLVALGLHQLYAHLSDKKIFAVKVKVPKVSHDLVYFLPTLCPQISAAFVHLASFSYST